MGQLLSQKAYHLLAVLNFCLMVSNELLLSPSCFIISLISPEVCLFESKENGFRKQSPWFISHLKNLLSLLYTSTFQTKNIKRGLIQRNLWMNKTWRLHSASLLKKKKKRKYYFPLRCGGTGTSYTLAGEFAGPPLGQYLYKVLENAWPLISTSLPWFQLKERFKGVNDKRFTLKHSLQQLKTRGI